MKRQMRLTATAAKNSFGRALDSALQGDIVVITKHDVPKAVLMSFLEYETLSSAAAPVSEPHSHTARVRAALKAALKALPKQTERSAAARRR